MTALNVFYHVPDGRRADFLAAIDREQIRAQVYQEPGCLRYDFYVDANSEDGLLLVEGYETEADFDFHKESAHFQRYVQLEQEFHVTMDVKIYRD